MWNDALVDVRRSDSLALKAIQRSIYFCLFIHLIRYSLICSAPTCYLTLSGVGLSLKVLLKRSTWVFQIETSFFSHSIFISVLVPSSRKLCATLFSSPLSSSVTLWSSPPVTRFSQLKHCTPGSLSLYRHTRFFFWQTVFFFFFFSNCGCL